MSTALRCAVAVVTNTALRCAVAVVTNTALRCAVAVVTTFGISACRALPPIPPGVCGNHVIEASETCDGFDVGGASCRAPGSVLACHLDCSRQSDGTQSACPVGWGCAVEGVCRKATGSYQLQAQRIEGNAFTLASGDFDGDGRGDVLSQQPVSALGASTFRVHFFDREAAAVATWASPATFLSLAISDASGDGRADVALTDGRMGVLLGQPNHTLISETYATYFLPETQTRLFSALYEGDVDSTAPLVVLAERDGRLALTRPDAFSASLKMLAEFPGHLADLAGEPVLGHVMEDLAHFPCADLALALRGDSNVSIYTFCRRDPDTRKVLWLEPPIMNSVQLEPAARITGGPLLADLDGDHHIDLLLATEQGLYVAPGNGQQFEMARPVPVAADSVAAMAREIPLAAGDFNGDGAADFVYGDGFLLSIRVEGTSGIDYQPVSRRLGSAWTQARIVDLNANGFPDIVAASNRGLDIDFFNGTGTNRFNRSVIATDRPVEHLTVGDYDGDLISDLAFTQVGPADEPQELTIAYGNSAGPPTVGLTTTRVGNIQQIGTLPYIGSDVLGELFLVFEQRNSAGELGVGVAWLVGTGTRSLMCMVELTSFAADGSIESVPGLTIATGRFARADRLDALLFGSNLDGSMPGMWLVTDLRQRTGLPQRMEFGFDARLEALRDGATDHPEITLLTAAGDSDGDGLDNLVVAGPEQTSEQCLVSTAKLVEHDNVSALQIEPAIELEQRCSRWGQLAVADLDADGAGDIVLLTGTTPDSRSLIVLWNDGAGGFSATAQTVLSDDAPNAFALVKSAEGGVMDLVYVTSTQARLLHATPKPREFSARTLDVTLEHATGVTAPDLDGDRVADLVIADAGSLRILRAELAP